MSVVVVVTAFPLPGHGAEVIKAEARPVTCAGGGYGRPSAVWPRARSNCFHPYPQGASPLTEGKGIMP